MKLKPTNSLKGLKSFLVSISLTLLINTGFSQAIPAGNLYLDQTPPGKTPKVFPLSVKQGYFAAERIAISDDGRDIYYSQIKGYYPNTGESIKRYTFSDGKWIGPVTLFEGYAAPYLSLTSDTMFVENNFETYISVKKKSDWSNPERILSNLDSAHYYHISSSGTSYISTKPGKGTGLCDWCKLLVNNTDSTAVSLGRPLNTSGENLDFFVSRDESFMILTNRPGLAISYRKSDGSWTNPRNFGPEIDFGLGSWGPVVTPDRKYMFYSTGTKPDYSDVAVYWVRIDGMIDSLKSTNAGPHIKTPMQNQNLITGQAFSFTVPENTFFDEDSTIPLTYSAKLIDGSPLPSWLIFDDKTATFSGTPSESGELFIMVVAQDSEKASIICPFKIFIKSPTD